MQDKPLKPEINLKKNNEIQRNSAEFKKEKMEEIMREFEVVGHIDDDEEALEKMKNLGIALFHVKENSIKKILIKNKT